MLGYRIKASTVSRGGLIDCKTELIFIEGHICIQCNNKRGKESVKIYNSHFVHFRNAAVVVSASDDATVRVFKLS